MRDLGGEGVRGHVPQKNQRKLGCVRMHFVRFEDCFEGLFFGTYSFLSRCYQLNGLLWPMGERDVHTHPSYSLPTETALSF